ncbi:hypothetical protein HWV62_23583 [Athelia sp. TMB]|nr:hypothetical protein HWV62_23583 [Athelia sp. TMB]
MFFRVSTVLVLALSTLSTISAHGVVTKVQGANGKTGVGFGVTDVTGKKLRLFNQASRYIKGDTSACGSQKLNGVSQTEVNEASELSKAIKAGLPTASSNGTISMTLFQVNADGAGPYNCEVSADASGKNFVAMKTLVDVPGTKGKSNAKNTAFPLNIQMPSGMTCTGTGGACLVRCKNGNSQPFGGCIAVTQAGSATKRSSVPRLINEARFHEDAMKGRAVRILLAGNDGDDLDTDEVVSEP